MNDDERNKVIAAQIHAEYADNAREEAKRASRDSELLERLDAQAHQQVSEIEKLLSEAEDFSDAEKHISDALSQAEDAASEVSWIYEQSYE